MEQQATMKRTIKIPRAKHQPLGAIPDTDSEEDIDLGGNSADQKIEKNIKEKEDIEKTFKDFSIYKNKMFSNNIIEMETSPSPVVPALTLIRDTNAPFVVRTTFREKVSRKFIGCLIKSGKVSSEPYAPTAYQYGKAKKGKEKLNSPLAHLKAYYSLIKKNEVEVKYERSGRSLWGRAYPLGLLSLCGLPREVRNTICANDYYDFDLSSAHPSIIEAICIANNIPCPKISKWLKRKEAIRAVFAEVFHLAYETDEEKAKVKDIVKDIINSTLYGGGEKNVLRWKMEHKLDMTIHMPAFHASLSKEIHEINEKLIKENKQLWEFVRHKETDGNKLTFLSYYAQEHELRIVSGLLEKLWNETDVLKGDEEGVAYCEYEYDGFKLLKEKVIAHFGSVEAALAWFHHNTTSLTGMKLIWELKPTIPKYDISSELADYQEIDEDNILQNINAFHDSLTDPMGITSDAGLAKYITNELFPKEFIFSKGVWYCWSRSDNKWRQHTSNEPPVALSKVITTEIPSLILEKLKKLITLIGDNILEDEVMKKYEETKSIATAFIRSLGTCVKMNAVEAVCKRYCHDDDVLFDMDGWKLGFNNGLVELETQTFRPYTMADRMTLTCGFDFDDELWNEYKSGAAKQNDDYLELIKIWESVFPDPEVRKLYQMVFARSLVGVCLEKFVIANGAGRNGKGLLNEFWDYCLGGDTGYSYGNAPHQLFTKQIENIQGSNVAIAKISKKRLIISKEPPSGVKYDNAAIKLLTGGKGISARMNYSNDTNTINHATFICECNNRPPFKEEPKDADRERIMDILFPNRFTDKAEEVNGVNVFPQNPNLKTTIMEYRPIMMCLALERLGELVAFGLNINNFVPECVRLRTEEYIQQSFKIVPFLEEYCERMTDVERSKWERENPKSKMRTPCITFSDLMDKFMASPLYQKLSKKAQADDCYKTKNIKAFLQDKFNYKADYEAEWYLLENKWDTKENKYVEKKVKTSVLLWWKFKPEEVQIQQNNLLDELDDE